MLVVNIKLWFSHGKEVVIIFLMTKRRHSPVKIEATEPHLCTVSARLDILAHLPFFEGLAGTDLAKINEMFHQKDYSDGDVIVLAGDPAEHLYVIAEGRVKLLHHSLAGKQILLDLLTPGEFFGALAGLGGEVYAETAQAMAPSCILVIDRETFRQVISWHPQTAMKVIDIMAARLQAANERVQLLSTMPVEARIADLLVKLARKFGETKGVGLLLQVPLSREDLAGMAGTTPESASRVISQFTKDGWIRSGRGWIALTDLDALQSIADSEGM
jgi:CRP-like cAMP-binding protein